jgi:hypothetical protein
MELKEFCAPQPRAVDGRAGKIAEFLGVPFSSTPGANGNGAASRDRESIGMAHWKALQELTGSEQKISTFLQPLRALFVYGWNESPECNEFLRQLTGGAVLRAKSNPQSSHRISVAADSADLSLQWAGLDFEIASGAGGVSFELSGGARNARILISRDGEPFFVQLTVAGTAVLLLGQEEIADLDAPASKEGSALMEFERLAPLLMFMRRYFGGQCWQAPATWASLIIDDPLLRRRYGYLDYHQLLESMERQRYSACIAFIPWNYRRTDPRMAAFFQAHSDRYSICVHGCDHTDREFCSPDERRLAELTKKALWRMERHQQLSGLPFAPVMVFPQGLFSRRAMEILAESQFLAAVNTSPHPVDCGPDGLTLRELLEPAITRFSNFPLFTRRYPKNLAECVLDLFVGKPLLLVEHHGYFRDGGAAAEEFVAKLNAVAPRLQWADLNTICTRASLNRVDAQNHRHIRFYTDRFSLTADAAGLPSCTLYRRALPDEQLTSASINGRRVEVLFAGQYLKIPISLEPLARAEIVLERKRAGSQSRVGQQGLLDTTKVLLRRSASEFRDNVLDKSPWASKLAGRSLKWLRDSK